MYRALQVNDAKNIPIRKAGEAMTRGMAVVANLADGTLEKATATMGVSIVDVAPNFDGINAIITPTDAAFEEVVEGQLVLEVPTYGGEAFATTEVEAAGLNVGDHVAAVDGVFVKATAGDKCDMYFDGPVADPTGLPMYKIVMLKRPVEV